VGRCDGGTLGPNPVYKLPADWGVPKVRGQQIRPGSSYVVHTECTVSGQPALSAGTRGSTWKWGDLDHDADADALDIVNVVDGFKGTFAAGMTFEQINVWACKPDEVINALDVSVTVDAFKGFAYPCAMTCP
jgi:hypothetical protein